MFKRATTVTFRRGAAFHSARNSIQRSTATRRGILISVALVGTTALYLNTKEIHNDASHQESRTTDLALADGSVVRDQGSLHSLVWGSNRYVLLGLYRDQQNSH